MHRHLLTTAIAGFALAFAAPALQAQTDQEEPAVEAPAEPSTGGMGMGGQQGMMGQGQGQGMMGQGRGMKRHGRMKGMHGMMGGMHGGGMPPGMMMMMFVMLDTDGDQALSLEEVLAVHERMFGYMDGDDDGKLTLEEMQGFMMKMRQGG